MSEDRPTQSLPPADAGPAPPIPPPLNAPPVQAAGGPPVIPWQRRGKDLGRARAYWDTIQLVIARNGRLDDFLDGPVDYKDAQKFRWRTIGFVVLIPIVIFCVIVAIAVAATLSDDTTDVEEILWALLGCLGAMGVLTIALAGATGVVSWFFCPRHYDTLRQNRAIALSYYTCAPLAFWPLVEIVIGLSAGAVAGLADSPTGAAGVLVAGNAALVIWWYQLILRAVHYIAARPGEQVVLVAILLPAAWALVELVMLIVPAGIVLLGIMYLSVT